MGQYRRLYWPDGERRGKGDPKGVYMEDLKGVFIDKRQNFISRRSEEGLHRPESSLHRRELL